jgi:two-component sensor histidine kinase
LVRSMGTYWNMMVLNSEAAAMEAAETLGAVSARPASETIRRTPNGEPAAAIDVASYLETIAEGIISGLSMTGKILLQADFPARFVLPLSKAIPLGLIVGELVINSVKYSHPTGITGVIKIECSRHNGAIVIEVSDDGVGLPEGFDPLATADAGLAMVRGLAAQLGASISFDNDGLGLCCTLRIPYADVARIY